MYASQSISVSAKYYNMEATIYLFTVCMMKVGTGQWAQMDHSGTLFFTHVNKKKTKEKGVIFSQDRVKQETCFGVQNATFQEKEDAFAKIYSNSSVR